jgi:hypothetical protein
MLKNKSTSAWGIALPGLLFALLGLVLLVGAVLSFSTLHTLSGALMPDGEFETLTTQNLVVFRGLFLALAVACFTLAVLTFRRGWRGVPPFCRQYFLDGRAAIASMKVMLKDWPYTLVLLGIMAVAVAYRLEYIYSSLHHDEAYTFMAFAHSLRAAISDYHLPNNHVFHTLLVYFSTHLFGHSPWAVRLPAFTAGVLLVPAVYALGRRVYDRWVGLGAGILAATSPVLIGYSVNARGYTLMALLGVLMLVLGVGVRRTKNRFLWGLISLSGALGMYTNPAFLFPFGILYVWLFMEAVVEVPAGYASRWDFTKYWLVSGLTAAGLTLVFYLPILVYSGPGALFGNEFVTPVPWVDFLETLARRLADTWADWIYHVPLWMLLLAVAGLVLGLIFHKKVSSVRIPMQVSALLWIVVLLIIQRPNAWGKIWVFLLPLVLLWAAAGLLGLLGRVVVKKVPLSLPLVALMLLVCLGRAAWLVPQLPELWALHGDEENAVLSVEDRLQSGAGLVVAPPDDAPVWYYAELHGVAASLYKPGAQFERLVVLVDVQEDQTPVSVIDERGPGQGDAFDCTLLQTSGRIQVYECQVNP